MAGSADTTVAAAVWDLLVDAGVEVAFGLPGVHNLPLWSDHRPGHPRIVGVRHEQAAGYAADGLARATGGIGVALTTTGPGAMNAVAALGEAATAGSPVLLLASDVPAGARDPSGVRGLLHEMADQAAPFASVGAHAATATDPESALHLVRSALDRLRRAPAGPAYVGIPSDVLAAPAPAVSDVPTGSAPGPGPEDPGPEVGRLARVLAGLTRPVIWAGGGVVQAGVAEEVGRLAEVLDAPIITTYAARGVLADHPRLVTAPPHEPEVAGLIGEADGLIVLGSDFDAMATRAWRMPLPTVTIAVGLGDQLNRTIAWTHRVAMDLRVALPELLAVLGEPGRSARGDARSEAPVDPGPVVRARLRADARTAPAMAFVAAVEEWPGPIVCDMAVPGYWVGGYARRTEPRRLQYPVGWGTLGYALPAAIGPAALGLPTLAVCGDGGALFAIGELATLAQEALPVTILLVDDGGYGMLRFDQEVFGHPRRGVDLVSPDWCALAGSFGVPAEEVATTEALGARLRGLAATGSVGPRLLLHRAQLFPPRTTSPRWFEGDGVDE